MIRLTRRASIALLLAGVSRAGSAAEPVAGQGLPWVPLAARYRVRRQAVHEPAHLETWTFCRAADRIALLKPTEEEVWLRDAAGIRLQRIFHPQRKLVDYSAGELRTLRIDARWAALGLLFDPSPGMRQRDEQITLQWDRAHDLPRSLLRRSARGRLQLTQTAVSIGPLPAAWPQPSADRTDYDRLDAADFGDMPDDPFVQQLLARESRLGWRAHD